MMIVGFPIQFRGPSYRPPFFSGGSMSLVTIGGKAVTFVSIHLAAKVEVCSFAAPPTLDLVSCFLSGKLCPFCVPCPVRSNAPHVRSCMYDEIQGYCKAPRNAALCHALRVGEGKGAWGENLFPRGMLHAFAHEDSKNP